MNQTPITDQQTLGEALRTLRRRRGLTQVQLAVRAGIDPSLLSRLETGRVRHTTVQTIQQLSGALQLNGTETANLVSLAGQRGTPKRADLASSEAGSRRRWPAALSTPDAPAGQGHTAPARSEHNEVTAEWLLLWARTAFQVGDIDAARIALESATTATIGTFEGFVALATVAENLGDPALVADLYARALGRAWALEPDDLRRVEAKRAFLAALSKVPGRARQVAMTLSELNAVPDDGSATRALSVSAFVGHRSQHRPPADPADLVRLAGAYRRALESEFEMVDPIALDRLAGDLSQYWRADDVAIRLWRLAIGCDPNRPETWARLLHAIERQSLLSPDALLSLVETPDSPERCRALESLLGPAEHPAEVIQSALSAVNMVPPQSDAPRAQSVRARFITIGETGGLPNGKGLAAEPTPWTPTKPPSGGSNGRLAEQDHEDGCHEAALS